METLVSLLDFCASAFLSLLVLRIYFNYAQVSFYHPLGEWILKLTTPVLKPIRPHIPHRWNWYGLDWTAIIVCIVLYWIWYGLSILLQFGALFSYFSPFALFRTIPCAIAGNLYALMGMILWMTLLDIILSWTSHQPVSWISQATRPFLSIFRRYIPSFYGLDFSSWILIIVLKFSMSILLRMMYSVHLPPRGLYSIVGQLPF
jgi:YggT family protein